MRTAKTRSDAVSGPDMSRNSMISSLVVLKRLRSVALNAVPM